MKTLQELQNAVTEAKQAYSKAAALPLIISRHAVLAMRRREYRASVIAYQNAKRRITLGAARREVASLKAANLDLSEAVSGQKARVQELQNTNKQLNTELARETLRAEEFSAAAGILAQRVKDLETGHMVIRNSLKEVDPPAGCIGIEAQVKWLVEEVAALRNVNKARATAHTMEPKIVDVVENMPGFEGQLETLMLPNDRLDIAVLRATVKHLPADWVANHAAAILRSVALPRERRNNSGDGSIWAELVMQLRGISFGLTPDEASRATTHEPKIVRGTVRLSDMS